MKETWDVQSFLLEVQVPQEVEPMLHSDEICFRPLDPKYKLFGFSLLLFEFWSFLVLMMIMINIEIYTLKRIFPAYH